jgi:hypothetical protein
LDILERVANLPISTWNFKADPEIRHIGPMAQDFQAAFEVGIDDKHIGVVDAQGVALAAIQGLNQKLEADLREKDAEIQRLNQKAHKLDLLERRLNELERAVQLLNSPTQARFGQQQELEQSPLSPSIAAAANPVCDNIRAQAVERLPPCWEK